MKNGPVLPGTSPRGLGGSLTEERLASCRPVGLITDCRTLSQQGDALAREAIARGLRLQE